MCYNSNATPAKPLNSPQIKDAPSAEALKGYQSPKDKENELLSKIDKWLSTQKPKGKK